MKVAFIARSTLYTVFGGSSVQILQTARYLKYHGVDVSIYLAHQKVKYQNFDIIHFFDLIRPSNILRHIGQTETPFVITPILVDYSEFDKTQRKGFSGILFRTLSSNKIEYLKTVGRWIFRKDTLPSKSYLWKGHSKSIKTILKKAAMILPNSKSEYNRLVQQYKIEKQYHIIPNGVDLNLFNDSKADLKDKNLVICVARIEGIKNQLNLIKAINDTNFTLMIIGAPSYIQKKYYSKCKKIASTNIIFLGDLPQSALVAFYKKAKVHVLPSWFETCGLSSLEAASLGCNIVITEKGFTRDYFEDSAFYCNPADIDSIYNAIKTAASAPPNKDLQHKVLQRFTWEEAAKHTFQAYKTVLNLNSHAS